MIATILPLLLANAAVPAGDDAALAARVAEIFRPYQQDLDDKAAWDYPVYSGEVRALIGHWQRVVPDDEPDALNDGDWLCQCQDWNAQGFKVTVGERRAPAADLAEVDVKIDLGFSELRDLREARLIFRKEGGQWQLDDIFAKDAFPEGLKQALRDTIREDEALQAAKRK